MQQIFRLQHTASVLFEYVSIIKDTITKLNVTSEDDMMPYILHDVVIGLSMIQNMLNFIFYFKLIRSDQPTKIKIHIFI